MAKEAAFWCVLLMMVSLLFPSDACSQTDACRDAVGQWEFRVYGRDCQGYEEEGKFIMTVDADCNLSVDIFSGIPYVEKYLVTNKSLMVRNGQFYATVDFTVDKCSVVVMKGRIIDGKKIEGTYRYEDGGGGTFKASKKKSLPKRAPSPSRPSSEQVDKPLLRW